MQHLAEISPCEAVDFDGLLYFEEEDMTRHEELTARLAQLRESKEMNAMSDDFAFSNGSNDRYTREIAGVRAELDMIEKEEADGIS